MRRYPIKVESSLDFIQRLQDEAMNSLAKQYDDYIMSEIRAKVNVDIDKEELLRALRYSSNSYEEGYKAGLSYAEHKPVEADWTPTGCEEEFYDWTGTCGNCHTDVHYDNYCPCCGAKLVKPDRPVWWKPEKKEEPKVEVPRPEGYGECWACRHASWDDTDKVWLCHSLVLCTGGQYWKDRKAEEDND